MSAARESAKGEYARFLFETTLVRGGGTRVVQVGQRPKGACDDAAHTCAFIAHLRNLKNILRGFKKNNALVVCECTSYIL